MLKIIKLGGGRIAFEAPKPTETNLPYTIATMLEQMGGYQITGALVYVGADQKQLKWKCGGDGTGEYRGTTDPYASGLPRGTAITFPPLNLKGAVGIQFPVNGKPDEDWHMAVTYEADDTYKVWLYQNNPQFTIIDTREDVYCDELKDIVESMYDRAIVKLNQGFIPL